MAETWIENDISHEALGFAVFAIESVAARLGMPGDAVYRAMVDDSDILYEYIIPSYDALHTQGKEYIVNDILALMRERGVVT